MRHYKSTLPTWPPRKLEEIDAELTQVENEIAALLGEVTE